MISIPGTLAIRTITGRHGDFNVGRLNTSIGDFVIKDGVLDQYDAGRYEGQFTLAKIKPSYYTTANGTLIVEIRAYLDGMVLDGFDDAATDEPDLQVQDPVEEEQSAPSTPTTPVKAKTAHKQTTLDDDDAPFGMPSPVEPTATQEPPSPDTDPDAALFGHIWPLGKTVRLDATVDRLTQRQQVQRLKALGYSLDFKSQIWSQQANEELVPF